MDEIDRLEDRNAQEVEFARRDKEAQAAKLASQPEVENCVVCDEHLPGLRRAMHCIRCVDCQTLYERRQRLFSRG